LSSKISSINYKFFIFFSNTESMEGITASEMAAVLSLKIKTVKKRLEAANIKPLTKEAVYPIEALETVRNAPSRGRPPKAKQEPPEPPEKPAKKNSPKK
jgi:hypothetical protein